jgi:hypothetical protein
MARVAAPRAVRGAGTRAKAFELRGNIAGAVSISGNASKKASGRLALVTAEAAQTAAQFEPRFQGRDRGVDRRSAHAGGTQLRRDIAQQDLHLAHRPHLAEELCRGIRDLMRLIQDHGLRARQQIAEALVLEREIGKQQVVIHDHDVGGLRVAPRLEHMAASELGTLLAQAVFTRRGNVRPERRLLRQIGEFRQIARLGGRRPACHPREHACHAALARQQGALLGRKFQSVPAQIVGPSLEQGDLNRQSERLRQQRNVAAK